MKTEQYVFYETTEWVRRSETNLGKHSQLVFLFDDKDLLKEQKHIDFKEV